MSYALPLTIRQRLETFVQSAGLTTSGLGAAAAQISGKYRRVDGGGSLQMENIAESAAYVATRLPATYAAVMDTLSRVHNLAPDFSPKTSLDIGAGPATATLAIEQVFEDVRAKTLLEPNKFLRQVGQVLLDGGTWLPEQLQSYQPADKYDLIIASYVLNELSPEDIEKAVRRYWSSCSGVMVVVETGTPHGAGVIARVRDILRSDSGAHLLGPCPQDGACPLAGKADRWCHFSERVERSKLHKQLKDADMGYEDEKFAWVAFARFPVVRPNHRLIGHPSGTKLRELQVCNAEGNAVTLKIPKSHALYKVTRKLEWGDAFDG